VAVHFTIDLPEDLNSRDRNQCRLVVAGKSLSIAKKNYDS
jgi:hypothetical protein